MKKQSKPKRGRPPLTPDQRRELLNVRLPRWLIDWIDTREESRAELVEGALKTQYRLKEPS
jgi:hypothetical protein